MINEVVLVGKIVEVGRVDDNKKKIVLEVERPFKEGEGRKNDIFICQLWTSIFNKVISFCKDGDMLAIRGRIENENDKSIVVAEKVVLLNKSKENILKDR